MVKVREDHPKTEDGKVDLFAWAEKICKSSQDSQSPLLTRACHFACDLIPHSFTTSDMFSPLRMGMEMVDILVSLHLDQESFVAALLYRFVRENKLDISVVEETFGSEITKLIKGVLGMAAINAVQTENDKAVFGGSDGEQLEKIRKMLVSIISDVRVALIKIAERTCVIRSAKYLAPTKRRRVSKEIFSIYAPLAHRLGIGYIKWELEDMAFSHLNPEAYKRIAKLLDEKRLDRLQYLHASIEQLNTELGKSHIQAEIQGRVKHIYSIWRKMQRKGLEFHELYDIRAVRVLVRKEQDCYASLGVVHSLWSHIPKEFDDYIATPKANGYQSLHTAVIGPHGKTLEVQIRTHAMHEEAELGVCSHWAYKGTDTSGKSDSYEQKLSWLRQVLEWHEEIDESVDSFADQWRGDVEQDRVYVFTRDGHVVDLPSNATPVDFAYRVHTEVGNRCRGAKVGGRIVPLTYTLKTGDQIDILTAGNANPSRDWLNPEMGYVATSRARAKVVSWFRKQDRGANIIAGQQMIDTECKRLSIHGVDFNKLAVSINLICADDLFSALGAGDIRLQQVIRQAQLQVQAPLERRPKLKIHHLTEREPDDVSIEGVGNLLTQIAGCCNPVPGETIIGYITQGRGVTIHRRDCINALNHQEHEPERMIEVGWSYRKQGNYLVKIRVEAFDRPGLIRDVSLLLSNEKVNVIDMATNVLSRENKAFLHFKIEVCDIERLSSLLAKVNRVSNVLSVCRNDDMVNS